MNIDGSPCLNVVHTPGKEETELTCVSPPAAAAAAAAIADASAEAAAATTVEASGGNSTSASHYKERGSTVEVVNGKMSGLRHAVVYLSYQVRRGCYHGIVDGGTLGGCLAGRWRLHEWGFHILQ